MMSLKKLYTHYMVCVVLVLGLSSDRSFSQESLQQIRDTEIEQTLYALYEPLFKVARVSAQNVNIYVIKSDQINAFVTGGANIFIYTGLIEATKDVGELMGVLAHELGHLAAGHLIRSRDALDQAALQSFLTTFFTIGTAVLTGRPEIGIGGVLAGQHLAERQFLSFSRLQETAADQAALRYLEQAKFSSRGLYTFLETIQAIEPSPTVNQQSPYTRSHPPTKDRLETIATHLQRSSLTNLPIPQNYTEMYLRMRAKLTAFLHPKRAINAYRNQNTIAERYGYAIALYRQGQVAEALSIFEGLIREEPTNGFFHEMVGQILTDNGRIQEAIQSYRKAIEYTPSAGLIHMRLALLLLETYDPSLIDQALEHLNFARNDKRIQMASLWRYFSIAYGRKGWRGLFHYARAEELLLQGQKAQALYHAQRAVAILPRDSSEWLRAQDILVLTSDR